MSSTSALETKTGFLRDICAYFRDFLDTDFKRQAAPKRGITLKDPAGNLTGIELAKYPDLASEVWRLLRRPVGDGAAFALSVPRRKYRGHLQRPLREVIDRYLRSLSGEDLHAVADRGSALAGELQSTLLNDPEAYADAITLAVKAVT
jgi:hypothetical protein